MQRRKPTRAERDFRRQRLEDRLGDAALQEEYSSEMTALGRAIDEIFNGPSTPVADKKVGFVLLVFPFGDAPGRCNFLSNGADRRDVVSLMKEMVARFEGQPEPTEGHA